MSASNKSSVNLWVVSFWVDPERFFFSKQEALNWAQKAFDEGLVDPTWEVDDENGNTTEGTELTITKWSSNKSFYDCPSEQYEFERVVK